MTNLSRATKPRLLGLTIQPTSDYCGMLLANVKLPDRCLTLGLLRHNRFLALLENPVIYAGDYLLAIALHPMMTPALKVVLAKTRTGYDSSRHSGELLQSSR
jgi:hypothetical protein